MTETCKEVRMWKMRILIISLRSMIIIWGLFLFIGIQSAHCLEPVLERGAGSVQRMKEGGKKIVSSSTYTLGKGGDYTYLFTTKVGYRYVIWTNWKYEDASAPFSTTMSPLPNSTASDYIEQHKGLIDIKEVYPNNTNPLKMPQLQIWGSKKNPTRITAVKKFIWPMIGSDVIAKLSESGKLQGDDLLETVELSPVLFVKQKWESAIKELYIVEKWWPSDMLTEYVNSSTKK